MTQEEYLNIDWHRGNTVRLSNGNEYPVKSVKKKLLVLYSDEYEKYFTADYRIIESRTSDFIDDTPKKPKTPQEEVKVVENKEAAKPEATAVIEQPAKPEPTTAKEKAAPATEAPVKKKRARIRISVAKVEKVNIK